MSDLDLTIDVGSRLSIVPTMLDSDGLEAAQAILWEIVFSWREILQDAWPRDTGLSFAMWTSRVRGLVLEVFNPVEYASFVHPEGGSEGESGEFVRDALEQLVDGATGALLQTVIDSESRRSSGLAQAARLIGARAPDLRLREAAVGAFQATGGRQRQIEQLGRPIGQTRRRTVLAQIGGVLVRFRERVRIRTR